MSEHAAPEISENNPMTVTIVEEQGLVRRIQANPWKADGVGLVLIGMKTIRVKK